jgi:hypothetical protein
MFDKLRPKATTGQVNGLLTRGNTTDFLTLQSIFDEPGMHTVQFGVIPPEPSQDFVDEEWQASEATITWSVFGGIVLRKMSVLNGSMISGVAQGVTVVIKDTTGPFPDSSDNPVYPLARKYRVTAQITKGVRPTGNKVTLPAYPDSLGIPYIKNNEIFANTTLLTFGDGYKIPREFGASSIQVLLENLDSATDTTKTVGVFAASIPGDPRPQAIKSYNLYNETSFVEVPDRATHFYLLNFASTDVGVAVTWGIDG